MLRIRERLVDEVMILDVTGALRSGGAVALGGTIEALAGSGHRRMLVNLARASNADMSGINALLGGLLTARRNGGDVKLLHMTQRMQIPVIVALHGYFAVFDSERDALESFGLELPASRADRAARLSNVAAA